uniref:Proline-rich transmembrane protein 3/4 domain-containing protein n=1 Tax=Denticeps clupeoides TaxID=299321 RepID=A0AAY4C4L5_9TELE
MLLLHQALALCISFLLLRALPGHSLSKNDPQLTAQPERRPDTPAKSLWNRIVSVNIPEVKIPLPSIKIPFSPWGSSAKAKADDTASRSTNLNLSPPASNHDTSFSRNETLRTDPFNETRPSIEPRLYTPPVTTPHSHSTSDLRSTGSTRSAQTETTTTRATSGSARGGTWYPFKGTKPPSSQFRTMLPNFDLDFWPPPNTKPQKTSSSTIMDSRVTTAGNVERTTTQSLPAHSAVTYGSTSASSRLFMTPLIIPSGDMPEVMVSMTSATTQLELVPDSPSRPTEEATPSRAQPKPGLSELERWTPASNTGDNAKMEATVPVPALAPWDIWTEGTTASAPESWRTSPTPSISLLPDCNMERSGVCNTSDTWTPTFPVNSVLENISTTLTNQTRNLFMVPAPPMFVPLHSDWNSAMATWGLAWDAHIYGLGVVFSLVTIASALNLLCLPLCCPSGCGYFTLVSLFLLAAGATRAFALLYDAYGHQDRLASAEASLLLYEAPFPCLTAAFGLVFLLLSMRSRMQLSYSTFQRPCFLACLVLLHFTAAFGPAALLRVDRQGTPVCLFLALVSRGAFVGLATFLSASYFVFYCYVRADSKHIYHLNNTSPTPAERYNRCPFAESQEWERAAAAVCLAALFALACAGLQLYAMLHAMGLAGGPEVFRPWPWWTFQLSCRICEAGVCLTLALVVAQPVYCSDHLPQPGSCWTELLSAKSPILPGSYQWTLNQQEKLAICDTIGHGETEFLPLYTLVDDRLGSSLNGLDLLYHSNRALAYQDLDLDLPASMLDGTATSAESSCTSDSTADLQPPSPINLRRSIDEALFNEALFPMSLFSSARPFICSDNSLDARDNRETLSGNILPLKENLPSDPGLYRTSSCVEILPGVQRGAAVLAMPPSSSPSPSSTCCSSPDSSLYRPSLAGSSLVLCSSPEAHSSCRAVSSRHQGTGRYRTLESQNSQNAPTQSSEPDETVQEEFISVCRQIDALSVCSETIDL